MSLRKIALLLFITCFIFICVQPVFAAGSDPYNGNDEYIKQFVQGTHKMRMGAEEWTVLGRAAQEQGRLEDAKKCYLKSAEIIDRDKLVPAYLMGTERVNLNTYNQEVEQLENIRQENIYSYADILVKQGNKEEALAVYDKECGDKTCKKSEQLIKKANLVKSMGDEARYKELIHNAIGVKRVEDAKDAAEGYGIPLPPFITILGLCAAMVFFARFSGRKKS